MYDFVWVLLIDIGRHILDATHWMAVDLSDDVPTGWIVPRWTTEATFGGRSIRDHGGQQNTLLHRSVELLG